MSDLYQAFLDPNFPFLRYAVIVGVLSSFCFGIVGSLIVTRRLVALGGAISHFVLAGIGLVLFLQSHLKGVAITPFQGAMLSAILCAIILAVVTRLKLGREDTVIGAIWAVGMAIGMVFLSFTPGYIDPMSYLFGSIILITKADILNLIILGIVIVVVIFVLYPQFWALCFDEEFSRVRNIPVFFLHTLLLILCAVTVVMMMPMIGIVLVLAQLTIPVLIGEIFASRLFSLFFYSSFVCALTTVTGVIVSYTLDLPAGPVIILISCSLYVCIISIRWFLRKIIA